MPKITKIDKKSKIYIYSKAILDGMDMLRPGEAAEMLGITRQTLTNLADRGILNPVILPSGHRRYKRSEIESILGGIDDDKDGR